MAIRRKRGARPGNYTEMQLMVACLIKASGTGTQYSGKRAYEDGLTCSFVKQAKIKLGKLPYGKCCRGGPCKPPGPCKRCCSIGGINRALPRGA